jgi:hypothetical protein
MKELIMQRLQQQAGNNILRDLRFFVGEIEPSGGKDRDKRNDVARMEGQSLGLTEGERERIDRALSGIRDAELHEILRRIYGKGLAAWKFRWRR